jgi:putative sterol carrier protein
MIRRRTLPPPAGSGVYELTAMGQALEPTLLALGKWGSQFVPASMEGATLLHANSYALTLKTFFRPERAQDLHETYALHIGDEVLQVQIAEGELQVRQGEALKADAVFHTDMPTYLGLLAGQIQPDQAVATGLMRVEGDAGTLRRFLNICGLPSAVEKGRVVV